MASSTVAAGALALLLNTSPSTAPTKSTRATEADQRIPTVRLIVFSSPKCAECEPVQPPALKRLGQRTGTRIEARYFSLDENATFHLLLAYEKYLEAPAGGTPAAIIGKTILHGPKEIEAHLETLVRQAGREGGIDWTELPEEFRPKPASRRGPPFLHRRVYLAYFYQPGCRECERLTYVLRYLQVQYPNLAAREFDLSEPDNKLLLEALNKRLRVPEEKHLASATVVVGGRAFVGRDAALGALEQAIVKAAETDIPPPWEISKEELEAARLGLLERFKEMRLWTVALAALVDGVNPCAFATIVFLVAYLATVGKRRAEVLGCGAAFTLGVFATYFAVGVGLKVLLQAVAALKGTRVWLFRGSAILCLALGALSLADYARARRRGLKEMRLVLPKRWRTYTRSRIARHVRARYLVPASLLLGATVSLVEFVCTGQVYLPTIVYVIGTVPNVRAYALLLFYNVVFVLPLVVVFALVAAGLGSQRLAQFAERHLGKTKLALAGVFLLLGIGLLVIGYRV